jgi:hypothetical protein
VSCRRDKLGVGRDFAGNEAFPRGGGREGPGEVGEAHHASLAAACRRLHRTAGQPGTSPIVEADADDVRAGAYALRRTALDDGEIALAKELLEAAGPASSKILED